MDWRNSKAFDKVDRAPTDVTRVLLGGSSTRDAIHSEPWSLISGS